jgi:hypothetical protein
MIPAATPVPASPFSQRGPAQPGTRTAANTAVMQKSTAATPRSATTHQMLVNIESMSGYFASEARRSIKTVIGRSAG